jgi:hypothetical protein
MMAGLGSLAAQIAADGEPAIAEILTEQREETLHLEFKTLSSETAFTRDDRKMLAAAICGFANAEGGLLIVGVETKKTDGVDTAFAKRPVKNLNRFRRVVTAALPGMLSPQHNGVLLIPIADGPDQGFLLIDVPPSDNRPHMSVAEKRYFRRGSDGTRVLDHAEIRELMFATREGALEIDWGIESGPASGDLRYHLNIVLTLRNVGRVPVVAPYVRLKKHGWSVTTSNLQHVTTRKSVDGIHGIYATRDLLVHVNDEIGMALCETGLDFRGTGRYELASAIEVVKKEGLGHALLMVPWGEMPAELRPAKDRPVEVEGFYGAENATMKDFKFVIDKTSLLDKFCKHMSMS